MSETIEQMQQRHTEELYKARREQRIADGCPTVSDLLEQIQFEREVHRQEIAKLKAMYAQRPRCKCRGAYV